MMNWLTFAIAAYLFFALQDAVRTLASIGGAYPILPLILLVFIGLSANSMTVAWSALVLGLIVDLQPGPVPGAAIVGPAALGYLVGAYVVVQVRNLLLRDSAVTLAVTTFVVGIFVQLVIVAAYTMRGAVGQGVPDWGVANQLFMRFLDLVYTAVLAAPVGWMLARTSPLWHFPGKSRDRL